MAARTTAQKLTVDLANAAVITHTAGEAYAVPLANGIWYVGFTLAFTTSQVRAASLGAFSLKTSNGTQLTALEPYDLPCRINGETTIRFAARSNYWFANPIQWNANAEFRVSGFLFMKVAS